MRILKFLPSQININYKNICRIASNRNLIVEEFLFLLLIAMLILSVGPCKLIMGWLVVRVGPHARPIVSLRPSRCAFLHVYILSLLDIYQRAFLPKSKLIRSNLKLILA